MEKASSLSVVISDCRARDTDHTQDVVEKSEQIVAVARECIDKADRDGAAERIIAPDC